MKANELMQFDWVCLENDPTPRQVDWIRSGEVGLFWNKIVTPPYLEPIPLTPEILEHNFERKGRNYVFSTDFYEVEIHEYNDGMYMLAYTSREMNLPSTQIANICFVHELQHAVRLCGIEMGIVL